MPPEDRSVQAEDRLYALEYNEVETRKKLDLNGLLICIQANWPESHKTG